MAEYDLNKRQWVWLSVQYCLTRTHVCVHVCMPCIWWLRCIVPLLDHASFHFYTFCSQKSPYRICIVWYHCAHYALLLLHSIQVQKYVRVGEFYLLSFKGVDDDDVYHNMMMMYITIWWWCISEYDDDIYHNMMTYTCHSAQWVSSPYCPTQVSMMMMNIIIWWWCISEYDDLYMSQCTVSELSLLSFTGVDDDDVYHYMMMM